MKEQTKLTLPPAADGGERHRLELLLVCQSQAVLHRLVQHLLALVGAPAWTVTVDDVLRRESIAGRQNGCGGEVMRSGKARG